MKLSSALLENEVSRKRFRDNNFIISLIREIREDEEAINKLQCIIRPDDKNEEKLSASQTLNLIKAAIVQQQEISEDKKELKTEEV